MLLSRARDLGIPFEGAPGPLNAITDVAGVEVGHATIIRGHGKLIIGRGPARTGVTAILPRGRRDGSPVFAGFFSLNGNGEMTGTTWVEESGMLSSPVMITNTHSVGVVRDAVIGWQLRGGQMTQPWSLPVVAETWDGYLNDINGFHVKAAHAFVAINSARGGSVQEGCVGGGTGMIGYGWKGGIGTASRRIAREAGGYTMGVIVQLNCGVSHQLTIAGVPIAKALADLSASPSQSETGSIIIVAATDAPLLPHQLKRVARRLAMGLARTGSVSGNGSGDLFLAFSTANLSRGSAAAGRRTPSRAPEVAIRMLRNSRIDPLFTAAVQATEEAIVNALVAATTMTGIEGRVVRALPRDAIRRIFARTAAIRAI